MQVGASSVEQADDGRVHVPHLVGSHRAKAHLRFGRMHAEPGAAPAELPYQARHGLGFPIDLVLPGALDEIPKPVVVALLTAPRGVMGMIIRRSLTPLN
jgi:hypothetical protein